MSTRGVAKNIFVASPWLPEWKARSMTSSKIFVSTIFRFSNVSLFYFLNFRLFSFVQFSVSAISVTRIL